MRINATVLWHIINPEENNMIRYNPRVFENLRF